MTNPIKESVREFEKKNGNVKTSLKELVIYFNTDIKDRITDIKNEIFDINKKIDELPCGENLDRLQKLETKIDTAKKIVKYITPIILTVIGIIIGIIVVK